MSASRLLNEIFGLVPMRAFGEDTSPKQAEREVNSAQSVFGRGPRPVDKRFKKAQSDLDNSRSVAHKDEALGDTTHGLRVTGDKASLGALQDALQEAGAAVRDNEDLAEWCEKAWKAIAQGARNGTTVTLPPFQETPDIDSFNDADAVGGEEEI